MTDFHAYNRRSEIIKTLRNEASLDRFLDRAELFGFEVRGDHVMVDMDANIFASAFVEAEQSWLRANVA